MLFALEHLARLTYYQDMNNATLYCTMDEMNNGAGHVAAIEVFEASVQPPQSWPQDRTDDGRTRFLGLKHPEAFGAALDWVWR